jgi:hypothetical protein
VQLAAAGQRPGGFVVAGAAAVGVAGDHVGAIDLQARRHLVCRRDASAEDCLG